MNKAPYSVLLVEDETSIREGIRDIIPWEDLGYRFVGEARNGLEALELFDELQPDLIITDIQMPKIDGLSMIHSIREQEEQGDQVKVVILTGFDEFSYARSALKLNVRDYLLKPVAPRELIELLENVKIELDERGNETKALGDKSITLLRRMVMIKLLSGVQDPGIVESYLSGDSAIRDANNFLVVIYDYDQSHRSIGPDDFRESFRTLNPECIRSELIPDNTGMLIEVFYTADKELLKVGFDSVIGEKRRSISSEAGEGVSAGIGSTVNGITELKKSYESAKASLSRRYVGGGGSNFSTENTTDNESHNTESEPILRFLKAVEAGSFEEWQERLSDIVDELIDLEASKEHCQELITLAVSAMLNTLRKRHIYRDLGEVKDSSLIKKIGTYKTLESLHRWLSEIIVGIAGELKEQRVDSSFSMAEKARKYIEDKYADTNLAVEDVCSNLGVSVSTFYRVFKTYHDMTFSTFLTEVRIRKAKNLIRSTDLRNKEIAFQVGFNSPHYFSHVFSKCVGYSPSSYRKNQAIKATGRMAAAD